MREVILSADGEAMLYAVPDEVAEHLEDYCMEFCARWLWESPEAARYRRTVGGVEGVCYNEADFIDYLNSVRFPQRPAVLLRGLGCPFYEIPDAYRDLPRFNF